MNSINLRKWFWPFFLINLLFSFTTFGSSGELEGCFLERIVLHSKYHQHLREIETTLDKIETKKFDDERRPDRLVLRNLLRDILQIPEYTLILDAYPRLRHELARWILADNLRRETASFLEGLSQTVFALLKSESIPSGTHWPLALGLSKELGEFALDIEAITYESWDEELFGSGYRFNWNELKFREALDNYIATIHFNISHLKDSPELVKEAFEKGSKGRLGSGVHETDRELYLILTTPEWNQRTIFYTRRNGQYVELNLEEKQQLFSKLKL